MARRASLLIRFADARSSLLPFSAPTPRSLLRPESEHLQALSCSVDLKLPAQVAVRQTAMFLYLRSKFPAVDHLQESPSVITGG